MKVHYRHRRNGFGDTGRSSTGSTGRTVARIVAVLVLLLVVYWLGKGLLALMGFGGGGQDRTATVMAEDGSTVEVSYEGKPFQTAESNSKLQPGDVAKTGSMSNASLTFFDGTWARLDQQTQVSISKSAFGSQSQLQLQVPEGTLWVSTPDQKAFSGAIVRQIVTPALTFELPPKTQALVSGTNLIVYAAGGDGVKVTGKGIDDITIGEGQQLQLPATGAQGDLTQYRSALTLAALRNAFAIESQEQASTMLDGGVSGSGTLTGALNENLLTISSPLDHDNVTSNTIRVTGKVSPRILHVRVNGKELQISQEDGSFSDDIMMPDGEKTFDLHFVALGSTDKILAEKILTVQHGNASSAETASGFPVPEITSPAKAGQTFKTTDTQVVIRGTTSADTASIMVNDYKLQLYTVGNTTWSYLASMSLNNLVAGSNTFDVVAFDKDGNKSAKATITIVQGEAGGVVSGTAESAGSSSSTVKPKNNEPLTPGVLSVTGPTAGTEHNETGTGFLLEGTTSAATDSIWINDYKLQLYKSGKKIWNYIASADFNNLKKGTNVYHIVARNKDGEVLDKFDYTVTYEPAQ